MVLVTAEGEGFFEYGKVDLAESFRSFKSRTRQGYEGVESQKKGVGD